MTYADVQARLRSGWNTWDTRSVLRQVLLPYGFGISLGLHELYRGTTLTEAQIGRRGRVEGGRGEGGWDDEDVTFGPHAPLGEYTRVTVHWAEITIEVTTAQVPGTDELVIKVDPLANQRRPALLIIGAAYLWNKRGTVRRGDETLVGDHATVWSTAPLVEDPYADQVGPYLAVELSGPVGIGTGPRRSLEEIDRILAEAEARHCPEPATGDDLAEHGDVAEHRDLVRDAISWNNVYEPSKDRVVTTVSRLWNVGKRGGFALFCWDNFFNALLADLTSTDVAYANVVEMCREVVPDGFVPNVAQGTGRKTYDGSQPPVGSMVCWELYRRHGERWFLDEVYPILLGWNRWWWRTRHNGTMISPGTTVFEPEFPSPQDIPRIGKHFGATCETGADDHPAFRDIPFDPETGLLGAHDVGLNAQYAMDCEALSKIAVELGRTEDAEELTERGATVRDLIEKLLWDEPSSTYRGHFTETGKPTEFLSPASFFPLLAGCGIDGRAKIMTDAHLRTDDGFGGEWVLPSSPRSELLISDREHSYWIGRAWPPINFLAYLGLRRAGLTEEAGWLAERSGALAMIEWRENRHIHENYSSEHGQGCDRPNSEPFHSWGALLSLPILIESGTIKLTGGQFDPTPTAP